MAKLCPALGISALCAMVCCLFALPLEAQTLSGHLWLDLNGNGLREAGEPPFVGVPVEILDFSFSLLASSVSDSTGAFAFVDVPDGLYLMFVDEIGLPGRMNATFDPDGVDTPFEVELEVFGGQSQENLDFGFRGPCALGDRVWQDDDGDGVQDAGEVGIPGVPLLLQGAGADSVLGTADDLLLPSQISDEGGFYRFEGLPPGRYRVSVDASTIPSGMTLTSGNEPMDLLVGFPEQGIVDENLMADFGYRATPSNGSIGGRIWDDADLDGLQSAGEAGLEGVAVILTDAVGGALAMAATDADGVYLFEGVEGGDYSVRIGDSALPEGYEPTYDLDGLDTAGRAALSLGLGATRFDVDFGYALCAPCSGGIRELTFLYAGLTSPRVLTMTAHVGARSEVVFNGSVLQGDSITVVGPGGTFGGTLGEEFEVVADGATAVFFDTSCSTHVGPGTLNGEVAVSHGRSAGGLLCTLPEGGGGTNGEPGGGGGSGGEPVGTGTPGYWKNHAEAWPMPEIHLGGVIYAREEAIEIMAAPGRGDKTYNMFEHLIAAMLNVANGTESSCIAETIDQANAWMAWNPLGSNVRGNSSAWRGEGRTLFETLVDYNEGRLCAPPRE